MSDSKNERIKEIMVGIFVSAIFLGLAVFTIVISGTTLFRNSDFEIEVIIPDAMGLRKNDLVIAKGTTVGNVTDVFYARDGVHVKALLYAPVAFYEDYDITVVSTSILGGRQLQIFEGNIAKPVVENVKYLKGSKPADIMEDATAAIKRVRDFLDTDALGNLQSFTKDIAAISDRLSKGEGTLGKLLSSNDEVYTNLNEAVANIRSITGRLESGEGTLGRLLSTDDTVYSDLQKAIANLRLISDRLESGEGTLGKLLSSDASLYDNIDGTVSDVRELIDDFREANTLTTFTSLLFSGF